MATYTETVELKDEVSQQAKTAASALVDLEGGLAAANKELVKASALGDQAGYDKALSKVAQYTSAIDKIKPVAQPFFDAKTLAESQAAASKQQSIAEKAAKDQADLTKKMIDESNKLLADQFTKRVQGEQEAADKQKQVQADALASQEKKWAMMDHAAQVGKETIIAAVTGIKNAFTSLAAGDVEGAIAGVTEAIAGMAKLLDYVVPGLGQAVSAVVSIAGGLVGVTAGLIKSGMEFAIASAEGKKQMLSMFAAMAGGMDAAEEIDEMLSGMADKIGITKDELAPLTQSFLKMGIEGTDALEKLTLAAISAQAIVGDPAGAQAFENLTKKIQLAAQTGQGLKVPLKGLGSLAEMGLKVEDVANKMGISAADLAKQLEGGTADAKKFGDALADALIEKGEGPLKTLGASIENIKKKFMQDIGDMFEDIDIGPFMKEVKDLFGVFAAATPSGQALKAGIQGFFQKTFDIATKLVPMVKHFMLDLIIYGLQAYIALKPTIAVLAEWIAKGQELGVFSALMKGVVMGLIAIVGVVALVVGWFTAMIALSAIIGAGLWYLIATIGEVGASIMGAIIGWVASAWQSGTDFVMGIVNGIKAGVTWITEAVTGLANSAVGAFKSALGIASPSKVMFQLGAQSAEGAALGTESGAPDVYGAGAGIGSAMVAGASGGQASGDTGAGGARAGSQIAVYVQIDGAGKSAMEITEEMVAAVMERIALAQGV